ncbi:MAG: helicase-associated domain-containing protein [Treponema sp.]|jgi:hypothetical protein|nr:helicase-associated domain-containing protein [Treponema sp.]
MNYQFHGADEWKAAILGLPDGSFFQLLRSVFGSIRTPFNKHRLMDDLTAFLSRRDIQETLASYIDDVDARFICAVALLGEPENTVLSGFFAGEYTAADIHMVLVNLEERFIIYRFREREGAQHLALNPLLKPVLEGLLAHSGLLFPSVPAETGAASGVDPSPDDRTLAALIAFAAGNGDLFKAEGGFRKKVQDDGRRLFPGLDFERLLGGLEAIGLIRSEGSGFVLERKKLTQFATLSRRERLEYWAAGIFLHLEPRSAPESPGLSRSRAPILARFTRRFTGLLEPGRSYPLYTLRRLLVLQEREEGDSLRWADVNISFGGEGFPRFLEALESAGLLLRRGRDLEPAFPPERSGANATVIALDSPFSCILYPEIDFTDALTLACFAEVRETGQTLRFEFTRQSVVRGLDLGQNAAALPALLERLSLKPLDQNLRWSLEDWAARYAAVSLQSGTVLVLAEDKYYLAEVRSVAALIKRTLAPGVYLLSEDTGAAGEILRKAGVEIIARPVESDTGADSIRSLYPALGSAVPSKKSGPSIEGASESPVDSKGPDQAAGIKDHFRALLDKMQLSQTAGEELAARIERKIILCESQLSCDTSIIEKTEARNLDYVGKTAVAKQAMALKSPVEVFWSNPEKGDGLSALLGFAEAIEKSGGETTLVIRTEEGPGGTMSSQRIPIGKISLIRRSKQSIFE